jgi:5'-3' exonuclease
MKNTAVIIDADTLLFTSCLCSKELSEDGYIHDIEEAKYKYDESLFKIINHLWEQHGIEDHSLYIILGGSNNFRKLINPTYKSKRKIKPPMFPFLRAWALQKENTYTQDGCEADDTIAALVEALRGEYEQIVIATVDKDLKQIPNVWFFDYYYTRMTLHYITEEEALHSFYMQMLTGDAVDDINLTRGFGAKKAQKLLEGVTTHFGYKRRVYDLYKKIWRHKAREKYIESKLMIKMNTNVKTPEVW